MNVQLNDSGVPIIRQKTFAQKVKSFLLWTILVILTIAAALLVYLCVVGASEMAALTTLKKVSNQPYYTMSYENFDCSDMLNQELPDNDHIIQYYKKKFFKSASGFFPGTNENETITKGSVAFFSRTFTSTYMRARIYNSYDAPIIMVTTKPQNGYKSWNIVDMSDVGLISKQDIAQWTDNTFQTIAASYCTSEGINQEGFGVSLISCPVAECDDTSLVNITPFVAVRLLLDRTATVESAIDLLEGYDIDFSSGTYHFFISEKNQNSAIIEYIDGKMSVTYQAPDKAFQVCSNRMEYTSLPESDKDYSNLYNEISLYDFFDKALGAYQPGMSQSYAQLLVSDKSTDMAETSELHFGTNMYGTLYSVFYDTNKMKMYIIVTNDTKSQSYNYDLSK